MAKRRRWKPWHLWTLGTLAGAVGVVFLGRALARRGWGPRSGWRRIDDPVVPHFDGEADFARRVAAAVARVAPSYGYPAQPTDEILAAQFALESGWGHHARGWNLGGIHAGTAWIGPYFDSTDADRPTRFAAFRDLEDFLVSGYFRFIGYARYVSSRAHLKVGDGPGFYEQLGRDGYYEGDPAVYRAGSEARRAKVRGYLGRS